ncbi:hypothetical protein MRB53_037951 [Persea americana]|nr:hypothetical protein MRB53_037951 [Persea americana]
MHFLIASSLISLAAAISIPRAPASDPHALEARAPYTCPSAGATAYCCETDVLQLADLTCHYPTTPPQNTTQFINECSQAGLTAECCTLNLVAGITLLCNAVSPQAN